MGRSCQISQHGGFRLVVRKYASLRRQRRSRRAQRQASDTQKKFIRSLLLLIAVALLIIFVFGDHGVYQLYKLRLERNATQRLITQLRENRKTLEEETSRLEQDLEYIERLARERYRMAKKGEKVFKVIKKDKK
ncbi:MAG: septum formation initiator family protein [FCB group bacterium]|nr:septum formation initiator family protein [FCB group bacterium]